MKKFLAVLMGGAIIASSLAFTACGETYKEDDNLSGKIPTIPDGVNLTAVADEDMLDTIKHFNYAYYNSDNLVIDYYYKIENNQTGNYEQKGKHQSYDYKYYSDNLSNIKVLKTANNTYLDNNVSYNYENSGSDTGVDKDDPYYDRINGSENRKGNGYSKVRDNIYTSYTSNFENYKNGKLILNGSGLSFYEINNDYAEKPLVAIREDGWVLNSPRELIRYYLQYKQAQEGQFFWWGDIEEYDKSYHNFYGEPLKENFNYSVEFKANDTKLYIKIECSLTIYSSQGDETKNYIEKQTNIIYIDTAAEHKASDFDDGKITQKQTKNVLYFPADQAKLKADFLAGKEITLTPVGGGDSANLNLSSCSIEYKYNDGYGSFDLGASIVDGKLVIAKDGYSKLIEYLTSYYRNFDESKIDELTLCLYLRYDNGVDEYSKDAQHYYCLNELNVDLK